MHGRSAVGQAAAFDPAACCGGERGGSALLMAVRAAGVRGHRPRSPASQPRRGQARAAPGGACCAQSGRGSTGPVRGSPPPLGMSVHTPAFYPHGATLRRSSAPPPLPLSPAGTSVLAARSAATRTQPPRLAARVRAQLPPHPSHAVHPAAHSPCASATARRPPAPWHLGHTLITPNPHTAPVPNGANSPTRRPARRIHRRMHRCPCAPHKRPPARRLPPASFPRAQA